MVGKEGRQFFYDGHTPQFLFYWTCDMAWFRVWPRLSWPMKTLRLCQFWTSFPIPTRRLLQTYMSFTKLLDLEGISLLNFSFFFALWRSFHYSFFQLLCLQWITLTARTSSKTFSRSASWEPFIWSWQTPHPKSFPPSTLLRKLVKGRARMWCHAIILTSHLRGSPPSNLT